MYSAYVKLDMYMYIFFNRLVVEIFIQRNGYSKQIGTMSDNLLIRTSLECLVLGYALVSYCVLFLCVELQFSIQ